jgi:hypothetical protein
MESCSTTKIHIAIAFLRLSIDFAADVELVSRGSEAPTPA